MPLLKQHLKKLGASVSFKKLYTLRLAEQGITVSVVELQAAIEKAYLEYKAKTKAVLNTVSVQVQSEPGPISAPIEAVQTPVTTE